jgi:hypothetical protein
MRMLLVSFVIGIAVTAHTADVVARPGTHGHYRVLPGEPGAKVPFEVVDIAYGPASDEAAAGFAWELTLRQTDDAKAQPLMTLRAVTTRDPLAASPEPLVFLRYELSVPATGEVLAYRNVHTGKALLPAWGDFLTYFVPHPARGTRRQNGMPNTCEYLGHVLTLIRTGQKADWPAWPNVKVLDLDPELLIGTSRNFKDKEGHRLPQKPDAQNYTFIPFTADDYRVMIETGVNLFVHPTSESYVRDEAVFYLRGAGGDPPLQYPADLYRSNYIGDNMFMDEPTCIMLGEKSVHTVLRYFTDAAALLTKRVRARYESKGHYGGYQLEQEFRKMGVSFGDMRLAVVDYPSWETVYETAYYQLAGGLAGIVHEGRYQLDEFNTFVKASTGLDRKFTAEEMLRYHYAFLRGAARRFDKDWGTSIYGQADPKISPLAVRLAYDMGARYLWYWTSDHGHHLPWPEQMELTKVIRERAKAHPRPSIRGPRPALDKLILIPYGYFLTLESPTGRKQPFDLWWVREMDAEGKNESSQRYRRLMRNAISEVIKSCDAKEDFDISVDDGEPVRGYRQVVKVSDE